MKKIVIAVSAIVLGGVLLVACAPDTPTKTISAIRNVIEVKILRDFEDVGYQASKDVAVLCIDGIKYLNTHSGSITAKYQANQDGDPSVEECEQ